MSSSGAWMRLTGLAAAGATLLAVISGATGFEHRLLAALALPPLVALVLAGRLARPRLFVPSLVTLVLFGAAALVPGEPLHATLAATRICRRPRDGCSDLPRRARRARRLARLRHADEAAHHDAAAAHRRLRDDRRRAGLAVDVALRGDDGRACTRVRRGERAEPRAGRGHRPPDGQADATAARSRPDGSSRDGRSSSASR